jgi:hypothetical protein
MARGRSGWEVFSASRAGFLGFLGHAKQSKQVPTYLSDGSWMEFLRTTVMEVRNQEVRIMKIDISAPDAPKKMSVTPPMKASAMKDNAHNIGIVKRIVSREPLGKGQSKWARASTSGRNF